MSQADQAAPDPSKLEMAYVLFMDIVAYSKLPMDKQKDILTALQSVVSESPEYTRAHAAGQIIKLPTGDGMALVFFGDVEAAARCALEISLGLKLRAKIPLRMGLHHGAVYVVEDINQKKNVAGVGINIAQRIMDCGDAGHILTSQSVADVLMNLSTWNEFVHDLGEAEVKHGVVVRLYNLYTNEVGNSELPGRVQAARDKVQKKVVGFTFKRFKIAIAFSIVSLGVVGFVALQRPNVSTLSPEGNPSHPVPVELPDNQGEGNTSAPEHHGNPVVHGRADLGSPTLNEIHFELVPVIPNQAVQVKVTRRNRGDLSALHVESFEIVELHAGSEDRDTICKTLERNLFTLKQSLPRPPETTVPSGSPFVITATGRVISEAEANEIQEERLGVYVAGIVTYTDATGENRNWRHRKRVNSRENDCNGRPWLLHW